jgi:CheY-like chemotaxis protein
MPPGSYSPPVLPPDARKVLVVEDDALIREMVKAVLEYGGYVTIATRDGREALEILSGTGPVDLVLTDVIMPGTINGVMVASHAARHRPGVPVILTSGYSDEFLRAEGVDPRSHLLRKPYRPQELLDEIAALLPS